MTVIEPEDNTGTDAQINFFRGPEYGIPFGRPGNAVDDAQCILGLVTVRTDPVSG